MDLRPGNMLPSKLREIADLIEKGNAFAKLEVEIIDENRLPEIGFDHRGWKTERYRDKKIHIEVTVMGRLRIQLPNGEWVCVS